MKARLVLSLLLAVAAAGDTAAEERLSLHDVARAIRDGKLEVDEEYSVDRYHGRLHTIHSDLVGMECTSCHYGTTYRADYLVVGKEKPYPTPAKGHLDRAVCLGCHREGGEASAFYGAAATGTE